MEIYTIMSTELMNFNELNVNEQSNIIAGAGLHQELCNCGDTCTCYCREREENGSTVAGEHGVKVLMAKKQFMG